MSRADISKSLTKNYTSFADYIARLPEAEFLYRYQQKWSASQQLNHIIICVKPLLQVFSMPKQLIGQTFGLAARQSADYRNITNDYVDKLRAGGKAPDRFLPEEIDAANKDGACESLKVSISKLNSLIETFTENELDSLLVPHPLVGSLTLREMLYNVIYHVEHHHQQAKAHLANQNLENQ